MPCPLCSADTDLTPHVPGPEGTPFQAVALCAPCLAQITGTDAPDPAHWRALPTTMWSEDPAVQVLAWRMLDRLKAEPWAQDALDQLWLDADTRAWAEAGRHIDTPQHRDSNGVPLATGDTVVLIKDLPVKGAGFTAKRGTAVPRISLVQDNPEHIEGRVDGQRIVILTQFVKKR